jgi:hypothetical protein
MNQYTKYNIKINRKGLSPKRHTIYSPNGNDWFIDQELNQPISPSEMKISMSGFYAFVVGLAILFLIIVSIIYLIP